MVGEAATVDIFSKDLCEIEELYRIYEKKTLYQNRGKCNRFM